ncbi:MAG: AAA family ATPase, partial [Ectothiorhodospiraceae bacterium]|nr:AAA family ATPase [Ectothiorhodospiraceae bacterium]
MNSVALYHLKGGVGKTATAVNLACLAAREGQRTLLWDLDPQGAASFYLRVDPRVKGGAEQLVRRRKTALRAIRGTDFDNLDLLPADFSERDLDLVLDAHKRRKHRLARLASRFAADYDWLILDCAPSISLVSENVFRAV